MHSRIAAKILSPDALQQKLSTWRLKSNKIVFTNGVFDLVHPGHADYLSSASDCGDRLIVGLNSDNSVKSLNKGDDRPINPEKDRAALLAALHSVDAVVIFDDHTPQQLIEQIAPDVLVKGGDYNADETDPHSKKFIVGSKSVRKKGGEVVVIPFLTGYSSTNVIEKIRGNG